MICCWVMVVFFVLMLMNHKHEIDAAIAVLNLAQKSMLFIYCHVLLFCLWTCCHAKTMLQFWNMLLLLFVLFDMMIDEHDAMPCCCDKEDDYPAVYVGLLMLVTWTWIAVPTIKHVCPDFSWIMFEFYCLYVVSWTCCINAMLFVWWCWNSLLSWLHKNALP